MERSHDENPYLLLTPGPLSTSPAVRRAMLRDWCTWDDDYNVGVVQVIREKLLRLAMRDGDAAITSVLMQGSGTFCVEAVVGTALPREGKLLVLSNGVYGRRIAQIAKVLDIPHVVHESGEGRPPDLARLRSELRADLQITHVAVVHGETSTGMLNPVEEVGALVKEAGRSLIVDAMSTFGGVPLDFETCGVDWLVSSSNKCIQGVPGFGFVLVRRGQLEACAGRARSLSLDVYDQWRTMETGRGKWRFTSPTHTVRAFLQALVELEEEGGVAARHARYATNQRLLRDGMLALGFEPLLPTEWQSPIITAFHAPAHPDYRFADFYGRLKQQGFVIYPGSITETPTFRIGTIGHVFPEDVKRLLGAVRGAMYWSKAA